MLIGPVLDATTTYLTGLHSIEVLIPSKTEFSKLFVGTSVEVYTNAPLRYSIWNSSLLNERATSLLVKNILTAKRNPS